MIVRSLGSLDRSEASVALPVRVTAPPVTASMLAGPARQANRALSAPVYLNAAGRRYRIPPRRTATPSPAASTVPAISCPSTMGTP